MVIKNSGFIGIGTTSPAERLDVRGYIVSNSQNNGSESAFYLGNPAHGLSRANLCNDIILYTTSGDVKLSASTASTTHLIIKNSGNVGIGTTSPSERLTIAGGGKIAAFKSDNTRRGVFYTNNDGTVVESDATGNDPLFLSSPGDSGTVRMQTGGTTRMSVGVNVGIGTTTPCTKLSVKCNIGSVKIDLLSLTTTDGAGSQPTLRFDTVEANCNVLGRISVCDIAPYAGTMIFETSGCKGAGSTTTTELMRLVGTTGNVGINCTTPTYRLHVNGTFYAAGSSIDYKQSICQYNTDSCMFMKLKPVTYQYKDEFKHLGKELKSETQIGLIAEDVAESYPELAILVNEEDNKVVRNVDYEKLSIILLSELQKLRKEVDELKQ